MFNKPSNSVDFNQIQMVHHIYTLQVAYLCRQLLEHHEAIAMHTACTQQINDPLPWNHVHGYISYWASGQVFK